MKVLWETKFEDRRWAFFVASTVVVCLTTFVYSFFYGAGRTFGTIFSEAFDLEVDLGKCSQSFSAIIMAQTTYSVIFCFLLLAIAVIFIIYALRQGQDRKPSFGFASGAVLFAGFLIGPATSKKAWWIGGLSPSSIRRGISLSQACLSSDHVFYPQLYIISIWLFGITWIALVVFLFALRTTSLHREYDDLPRNPALATGIIAKRSQLTRPSQLGTSSSWKQKLSLILIICFCALGLLHGLQKIGVALAKIFFSGS